MLPVSPGPICDSVHLSLPFMTVTFCTISLKLDLREAFWCLDYGSTVLARTPQSQCAPLSVRSRMPTCFASSDVHFDHLVKVVTAGLPHCETTLFSFFATLIFRECRREGGKREREETSTWEGHWFVASYICPSWGQGWNLQLRFML